MPLIGLFALKYSLETAHYHLAAVSQISTSSIALMAEAKEVRD